MSDTTVVLRADGRPRITGWRELSPEEKAARVEAARPFAHVLSMNSLSLRFSIPSHVVLRELKPGHKERERERLRNRARDNRTDRPGAGRPDPETVAARLAEIPPDTRTITGYLMGDPLPGRSALDRRTP